MAVPVSESRSPSSKGWSVTTWLESSVAQLREYARVGKV